MADDIKELKRTMSHFMGGANPPFNPSPIQSPKIRKAKFSQIRNFRWCMKNHEYRIYSSKEVNTIQSTLKETTLKLKENYLSTMVRTIRTPLYG